MSTIKLKTRKMVLLSFVLVLALTQGKQLFAADPNQSEGFLGMSIEELMNVEVTSSARRAQPIARSTAAIYVITAEDIRMAGVTTLADLLRLVPGMQVNEVYGFSSEVGIRGFAKRNADRIQILLDGVSMYDPFKGGCEFEFYPIILDDIDRIEVIRGPAAVAWGVNAADGVINIITKKVADTKGFRAYGGFASNHTSEGYVSLGGQTDNVAARATVGGYTTHGMGMDRGNDLTADYFHNTTATGRGELRLKDGALLTISGGERRTTFSIEPTQTHPSLEYMALVWDKKLSKESSLKLTWAENWCQNLDVYGSGGYDYRTHEDLLEIQNTLDLDTHKIVWGGDYTRDTFHTIIIPGRALSIDNPAGFANDQFSAFAEDEITLADSLWFTLGGRLQHNELTGQDWAGNAVLTWEVAPKHFLRTGVSRAFVRPVMQADFYWSRSATSGRAYEYPTDRYAPDGIDNEHITAYQLGYRGQITKNFDLDIEGFYHKNTGLIGSYAFTDLSAPAGSQTVRYTDNLLDVDSYGVETSLDYKPFEWWLIRGSHSYEHQTEADYMNQFATPRIKVPSVPKHTVALTNRFYLDNVTTLNIQLFYTDTYFLENKTSFYAPANKIDPRIRLDVHLARKIWNNAAEIAIGVKNLNDHYHYEGDGSGDSVDPKRVIARLWYVQFRYQF